MNKNIHYPSVILYLIGFFLVWEWLRPLEEIAEFVNINIFLAFLAISLLFFFLKVRWYIALPVNTIYVLIVIDRLFFPEFLLTKDGLRQLISSFQMNIGFLFQGEWLELTNSFRTLLFFIFIWLISYLIHYWLTVRKSILLFFLFTILFLSIADTFAPYNAQYAILRTVVFGFLALGLLTFFRLKGDLAENGKIRGLSSLRKKWLISLAGAVFLSTTLGILVPKAGPKWPDPIPFIQSYADHHFGRNGDGRGIIQKIGYDENDSYLGGPFIQDENRVFQVYSRHRQYWRVEVKDSYTGKGWEASTPENRETIHFEEEVPINFAAEEYLQEEELDAIVQNIAAVNYIIYPYGVNRIYLTDDRGKYEETILELNHSNEKLYAANVDPIINNSFYRQPVFEINALRNVTGPERMEPSLYQKYTQLPDALPERVIELAANLTAAQDNWYDKAKSIETYLRGHEYTYETQNVAVPGKDDDYVDQFLFETKMGYCDNFSTSMVVLLRAAGIPARWAKGYNSGEEAFEAQNDFKVYYINNNHAHSWVEAYFPGIGWVPFEPTKGFDNPTDFYYDLSQIEQTPSESVTNPNINTPELAEEEEVELDQGGSSNTSNQEKFYFGQWIQDHKNKILGIFAFLIAASFLLYIFRVKWLPSWFIFRYRKQADHHTFAKAYLSLLKQLNRFGLVKKEGETLRNYAESVDSYFRSNEMGELTAEYEKVLYGGKTNKDQLQKLHEKWESLMKRTR